MTIPLTSSAIRYTLRHILYVAAPAIPYHFEPTETADEATVRFDETGYTLVFRRIPQSAWDDLIAGTYPMQKHPSFDGAVSVPVLLEKNHPFAEWEGDTLTIHADLITLSFLLLSRAEELIFPQRDQYGRFRYEYSIARKYQLIGLPIVDEWAMLLRETLLVRISSAALGCHPPSLRPTHDMDTARRFPSLSAAMRTILGGDLLRRKSPAIAAQSLRQYMRCRTCPEQDPELLGAEMLLNRSKRCGLVSEFYFMGLEAREDDFRYNVQHPAVKGFAQKAEQAGMICGFHASRLTPTDAARFALEQQRVSHALGHPVLCGRQHFLCFDAEKSPRIWDENGFTYDSTLSYADHEGFRCGTCHAYPLYDLENDCPLTVLERPLIAMDGTLQGYRRLPRTVALENLKHLFDRSFAVGGDFVILWHNGCVFREWEPWFREVYSPFIEWAAMRLGKDINRDE